MQNPPFFWHFEPVLELLPAGQAQVMPVPRQLRRQREVVCAAVESEMENSQTFLQFKGNQKVVCYEEVSNRRFDNF